ncbi:PWI domain-containing protein [Aspergillus saccharolyticus JOP 1030-1]|uniref:PWI domain-containing protein n=1 Tax=Aspergillus saccharolyticus JOP 1030-1 TaxID=1450539 RepID=A0A318ZK45_9EURO|nr:hypothetical protein BP01DRAFT_409459 [Aspergillus saccharolyticus JOP 1030-1]PYH47961.1 hypothetical protein BP01DRAFT_409459 [Aspergillus saccharolyticus JOP 1030-1]
MATSVDAKLLRQTKFPPEFSRKVDMKKVNIEVMKKWIAGKISEILGNEDDVVIELCFNLLEGSRFPDVKSLQIQLTGFLDKDTAKFCKELWSLCLSAQENPQGVPKELLEAKKLELIQEKPKKPRKKPESRKSKNVPGRGSWRTSDEESAPNAHEEGEVELEEVVAVAVGTLTDGRGPLLGVVAGSVSESHLRDGSLTRTSPPAPAEVVGHPTLPAAHVLDPSPHRGRHRRVASSGIRAGTGAGGVGRLATLSLQTAETAREGRADAALITSFIIPLTYSQKRPPETEIRLFAQCVAFACREGQAQNTRLAEFTADIAKARKPRDDRRLSRSRSRDDHRRRRRSSRARSRDRSRSRGPSRSVSQDSPSRSRTRSRSPARDARDARDRKRRRSIERYAPAGRRRSSASAPGDKRQRMAADDDEATRRPEPPAERTSAGDHEMKEAAERAPSRSTTHARISSTALRERILREQLVAKRRTGPSDKVGR